MLTDGQRTQMRESGYTFEEIAELEKRIASIGDGNAKFLSEEDFWNSVHAKINLKMKGKECIK